MAPDGDLCFVCEPGGIGWSAVHRCQEDKLCEGQGVPQDILKTSSGPWYQRSPGSSDAACSHPQQVFCETKAALWDLSGLLTEPLPGLEGVPALPTGLTGLCKTGAF